MLVEIFYEYAIENIFKFHQSGTNLEMYRIKEFFVMALADDFTPPNQWRSVKNK